VDSIHLTRRRLLAGLGVLSTAALTGCTREAAQAPPSAAPPTALELVAPRAAAVPAFAVLQGQSELLVGPGQRVAFGLVTMSNEPIPDPEVEVRYVAENRQVGGTATPTFHPGVAEFPVYLATIDVPAPGIGFLVATTPDGSRGGEVAILAVDQSNSATVPPGQPAISTRTPTTADPLGVPLICTRRVGGEYAPCGMHASSLDQSLTAGRPVMLSFATPQFCSSAMCGPAVDTIETVRTSRDWGDLDWIHVEIFRDPVSNTLIEAVKDWNLPSEPWLFSIDRTGTVVGRLEGPIVAEELPALAERITT